MRYLQLRFDRHTTAIRPRYDLSPTTENEDDVNFVVELSYIAVRIQNCTNGDRVAIIVTRKSQMLQLHRGHVTRCRITVVNTAELVRGSLERVSLSGRCF